jgi:uncharacterized protein YegP (UPF0339 family)
MAGEFEFKKRSSGVYHFVLKAGNGETSHLRNPYDEGRSQVVDETGE